MAKKLEGAVIDHNGWIEFDKAPDEPGPWQKATLVIGEERVFTESEVRAIMNEIKVIATEHSRKCYTYRIEQMTPPAPVDFYIDNYLWKSHGISSDSA